MKTLARPRSALSEIIGLQLQLHEQFQQGTPNSERADEIRDAMEFYWWKLDETEQSLVEGLAADLFSIDRPANPPSVVQAVDSSEFAEAVKYERWQHALELVRLNEAKLGLAQCQYLRGICWMHLGYPNVANKFFKDKLRLEPPKPFEEIWVLTSFIKSKNLQEAIPRALEIARTGKEPLLMMKAAQVLSLAAEEKSQAPLEPMRAKAIELSRKALELSASLERANFTSDETDILESLMVSTFVHLAIDLMYEEQPEEAYSACQGALALDPNNEFARQLTGWLIRNQDEKSAKKMFLGAFSQRLSSPTVSWFPNTMAVLSN